MNDGFPLLTTKKMAWKVMVTELLWFLSGSTNIQYLVQNGCHIWDGDAYKNYVNSNEVRWPKSKEDFINTIKTDDEFAKKHGELGPIYGAQWRQWNKCCDLLCSKHQPIDQIANLINELKTNPDSRRLLVSAWNPADVESGNMVLPPCHYGFQVYTRELDETERFNWYGNKIGSYMHHDHIEQEMNENNVPKRAISLMWNQRSVDTALGLPMNIASYGLLLKIIAKEVNMIPEDLIGNLGDCHLYLDHLEGAKEQLTRIPFELPTIKIEDEVVWKEYDCLPSYKVNDFTLENYQSHPKIYFPLSN
jgi:thymidylate synthase